MNKKSPLKKNINSYSDRHRRRLRQEDIQLLLGALLDDIDSSPQTSSNVGECELLETNESIYDEINLQDNYHDNNDNEKQVQKNCETEMLWDEYEYEYLHAARRSSDSESSEQEDDINDEIINLSQFQENEEQESNEPMKTFLTDWAIRCHINHDALSQLLRRLRQHECAEFSSLPIDSRTLLQTPKKTTLRDVPPGMYYHFGLTNGIFKILSSVTDNLTDCINLQLSVDGLPLWKSMPDQLWPILASIIPYENVFTVGIYCGKEKPACANNFFEDLVKEAKILCSDGIIFNGRRFPCYILQLICDTSAKSFALSVISHTGYRSCTKCTVQGDYIENRICFPRFGAPRRTDEDFKNKIDESYHKSGIICNLLEIPNFGPVTNVPEDYMHVVCLGIARRSLNLWLSGDLKYRLRPLIQQQISAGLENELLPCLPIEFGRKPKSLRYARMWKATEYRQFLFYTGPIALKSKLRPDLYNHFVSLHVAVRIMCCKKLHSFLPYAQQLLEHYVSSFAKLYGRHNVSHNVHGLIHLVEDVENFGPLDGFSAYKFENYMQTFKRLIRKPNQTLQQIIRRITEMENNTIVIKTSVETEFKIDQKSKHNVGPLIARCSDPQYKFIRRGNVMLKAGNNANSCCGLSCGKIVLIENIAYCLQEKSFVIIGREFLHRDDVYKQPCNSSLIGIYTVHTLSELQIWPLQKVVIKYVKVTLAENNFAVFPLLHTDTINVI